MADDSQQGEKTEEPSSHRIEEFRKRGEVASSKELTSVLLLAGCIMTLGLSVVYIYETMAEFLEWLYGLNISSAFSEQSQKTIAMKTVVTGLKCVGPIFLVSFCIGVLSHVMQFGLLYAPEVLQLKLERINPINGMKKLFSTRSLVEAIKGVFKFTLILSTVYYFMKDDLTQYGGFLHLELWQSFLHVKWMMVKLGFSIVLGLILVAVGDFAYQKFTYKKKLRQTKEEAKRELKEQEGSPEVRQRIRSIQREMAQRRMMADIPKADVIVTNPTHISVVLKYDAQTMVSPRVIGKGVDFIALKIREIAKKHNIPIVENVPLARTLNKTVKTGEYVPRTLYKAVAEILAFVYKLKKKQKALG